MTDLKIIIPMAGMGKRLTPLTAHRPKPLVRLADGRLLDHVLNTFQELDHTYSLEYIFIIGHLGEQIRDHMKEVHPAKKVAYFAQDELMGQSHAVYLAREAISGPVLLTYCDTINEVDFSFLDLEAIDGVASVYEVDDPRRHGVAVVGPNGVVTQFVEKPITADHKLALTGIYYLAEGKELVKAIETQIERNTLLNSEYYLADAVNILIENGARIRIEKAIRWLDSGTPGAVLETNAYLLEHGSGSHSKSKVGSNTLIPPIYVHESAQVENSTIGPNVAIGANCIVNWSSLRNVIVDDYSNLSEVRLENSLVGKGCSFKNTELKSIVAEAEETKAVDISVL